MVNVFQYTNYKKYVADRIQSLPNNGRGEYRRIAQALRMHTTHVSQVFSGSKELSFEHACDLCEHFGLSDLEADYFVNLVQAARAGTERSRKMLLRRNKKLQSQAREVSSRIQEYRKLGEAEQALFYSSWQYSAVRLLTSIPEYQSLDALAERMELPKNRVRAILDFLISTGLCIDEGGKPKMGPQNTHIEASSPLVARHHANWRIKSLASLESRASNELVFTAPVSIARDDVARVREILLETISEISKLVSKSKPEDLAFLCIDWLKA